VDVAEKLWEIEQIKQLRARALRLFDTRDVDAYAELFTDDCEITVTGPAPEYTLHGRKAVSEAVRSMPEGTTAHRAVMPEIELIDATHARGIWSMRDYVVIPGHRNFVGYGHYHDEYEKSSDGQWRFRRYRITRIRIDELGPVGENPSRQTR